MHYFLTLIIALVLGCSLSINGQFQQQPHQPIPFQQNQPQPQTRQNVQPQPQQQQQQQQQQCDFSVYDNCVKTIYEERENKRQGAEGAPGSFDEKVKGCFKNSGCKEPNFNENSRQKQNNENNRPPPQADDMQKRRQCFVNNNKKARSVVEQCVQKTIPNFHFPDDDNGWSSQDRPMGGFRGGQGNMAQRVDQSCPDSTSRDNANGCLRNLWRPPHQNSNQTESGDQARQKVQEHMKEMCDKKDTCFKQLSPQCQKQYNDIKTTSCNCAQNDLKSRSGDFDKELDQCMGDNSNPGQFNNNNNNGGGGRKRSSVDRMIKKMCQTDDSCKNGVPNQANRTGPQRPPFHGRNGGGH